jgi:hypothetical protein
MWKRRGRNGRIKKLPRKPSERFGLLTSDALKGEILASISSLSPFFDAIVRILQQRSIIGLLEQNAAVMLGNFETDTLVNYQ